MNFIISGRNIDITPGLRQAVEQKLGKLEKYFTPETDIIVTLSVEKERQKIEVTIPVKGNIIRSEQESSDMYVSIDLVEEIIERQLRKYKTKLIAKQQGGHDFRQEFIESDTSAAESDEIEIVRITQTMTRSRSFVPRSSISSPCIPRMPAFRWNFSDITSTYSAMLRQTKSMSYIRERMEPTV